MAFWDPVKKVRQVDPMLLHQLVATMSTTIWNTIYTVLDPELLYVNKDSGHMHERLLTLNILGLQFELYFWTPKPPNLL